MEAMARAALLAQAGVPSTTDSSTKPARKVYVGNVPMLVTEMQIKQFFNTILDSLLPNKPPGEVVTEVYLNAAKRFAFIEHRSIEEANFTISLDGLNMMGCSLKLRRPQDYNATLAQAQLQQEIARRGGVSVVAGAKPLSSIAGSQEIVSTSVEDSPNKVFIGGLPHNLSEQNVKEMLQKFGPLKAFHLVKERERDTSKGFAFCEWRDPNVTDVACANLNGTVIGDRTLNVRRALPHGSASSVASVSPTTVAIVSGVPKAGGIGKPSRVMSFTNLLTVAHLSSHDEIRRLMELARDECAKIAAVRVVEFHNGAVLVEFPNVKDAARAIQKFQNGVLDGRVMQVSFAELTASMQQAAIARMQQAAAAASSASAPSAQPAAAAAPAPAPSSSPSPPPPPCPSNGTLPNDAAEERGGQTDAAPRSNGTGDRPDTGPSQGAGEANGGDGANDREGDKS